MSVCIFIIPSCEQVNGVHARLPVVIKIGQEDVDVRYADVGVILSTSSGLRLTFDGTSQVDVTLPKKYRSKMCGLCGFYDGIADNDFMLHNNEVTNKTQTFADSWTYGNK